MLIPILLPLLLAALALLTQPCHANGCQRRVCYYTSNAKNRQVLLNRLHPEHIDTSLCSHLVYLGAALTGNKVESLGAGTKNADTASDIEKVIALKKRAPHLLILLSVFAWNCDSDPFLGMSSRNKSRTRFVSSTINFLRTHGFDGVVLHCINHGMKPSLAAKTGLSAVISDLKEGLLKEARGKTRLLLVLAAVGELITDEKLYDISNLSKNVDWFHILAYNLHNSLTKTTGLNSPLYSSTDQKGGPPSSVDAVVKHWISHGAPRDKLVLGLPTFGTLYNLYGNQTNIGAPASLGLHISSGEYGIFPFFEICKLRSKKTSAPFFIPKENRCYLDSNNETSYLVDPLVPYIVDGRNWVDYHDVFTLCKKTQYIKDEKLAGFALVSLECDDFSGRNCGLGRYPLLRAANFGCLS